MGFFAKPPTSSMPFRLSTNTRKFWTGCSRAKLPRTPPTLRWWPRNNWNATPIWPLRRLWRSSKTPSSPFKTPRWSYRRSIFERSKFSLSSDKLYNNKLFTNFDTSWLTLRLWVAGLIKLLEMNSWESIGWFDCVSTQNNSRSIRNNEAMATNGWHRGPGKELMEGCIVKRFAWL